MRFDGRVAIVTGSGRGIGRAIALRFAEEGGKVAVVDKVQDTAANTVESIKSMGGQAIYVALDVTRSEDVRRMVQNTLEHFGKIDILVNNVGWFDTAHPFLETGEESWDQIISINLKSTLLCCHHVLKEMVKNGYGKIVNISSGAGRVGQSGQIPYSAAKAGVIGLTKALAREVARYRINVNCVCPGVTDTPLEAEMSARNPKRRESLEKLIPWRRVGKPEEVAALVCFLASDDAEYITGQTVSVDGGITML